MLNKKENYKKTRNRIVLFPLILTGIFLIVTATIGSNTIDVFSQQEDENEQQQQQQQNQESSSSFVLIAKLLDDEYRWIDAINNATNPTLNITSGVNNQITIKSLEGDPEEHELTIEGFSSAGEEGEEIIASDEIEDGSSTTVNFNTADLLEDDNNYQSLEYYCEYHPDTMRGKIQIK